MEVYYLKIQMIRSSSQSTEIIETPIERLVKSCCMLFAHGIKLNRTQTRPPPLSGSRWWAGFLRFIRLWRINTDNIIIHEFENPDNLRSSLAQTWLSSTCGLYEPVAPGRAVSKKEIPIQSSDSFQVSGNGGMTS